MPRQIFSAPALPNHYVAESTDGHLYAVPVVPNGWHFRRSYHGNYKLTQLPPQVGQVICIHLGANSTIDRIAGEDPD